MTLAKPRVNDANPSRQTRVDDVLTWIVLGASAAFVALTGVAASRVQSREVWCVFGVALTAVVVATLLTASDLSRGKELDPAKTFVRMAMTITGIVVLCVLAGVLFILSAVIGLFSLCVRR